MGEKKASAKLWSVMIVNAETGACVHRRVVKDVFFANAASLSSSETGRIENFFGFRPCQVYNSTLGYLAAHLFSCLLLRYTFSSFALSWLIG